MFHQETQKITYTRDKLSKSIKMRVLAVGDLRRIVNLIRKEMYRQTVANIKICQLSLILLMARDKYRSKLLQVAKPREIQVLQMS